MSTTHRTARVVLPADPLDDTLAFFTGRLGFRVASIFPADAPRVVTLEGHGLRIELRRDRSLAPGRILLEGPELPELPECAPNGTQIERCAPRPSAPALPPLVAAPTVVRAADGVWGVGRAGMRYRDLIPGRQGGRFIASHIRIDAGGEVPDYIHYHEIALQLIYCLRGSVRVVYEDQGEPFEMSPGDCVLQPPQIRHRVLSCSDGLEVIEVSCPAEHMTRADPDLVLPNGARLRTYGGQSFVRHVATRAEWHPHAIDGFVTRELGLAEATDGQIRARIVRGSGSLAIDHDGELWFGFLAAGRLNELGPGDAIVILAGPEHARVMEAHEIELFEVTVPASPG